MKNIKRLLSSGRVEKLSSRVYNGAVGINI